MKKLLMAAAAAALMLGAASASASAEALKACWVYVGPIGDYGYSYQHHQGLLAVQKEFGDKVETAYAENVSEADSEKTFERFAREGCKIIFGTSFGFMEPMLKVAKKFPDVKFEHATGYKTAPNMGTYNAKFHEGRYVIGQIAAKMSKTGVAGYIVSFPIPEVISGINAFMLGAQSVNPNFKVKIVWANTWFDPAKEADAAKVLLSQGADITVQHTDSAAPLQVAQEQGKLGFGQASDQYKFAPKAQLTAIVDNWAPHYIEAVKAVMDGTWKPQQVWEGMENGTVSMAPYTNMPDDVAKMATETAAAIASGKLNPFTGPITKQDGTVVGEAGKPLADGDILGMNWYVKGVDDKLPQ
ncbi:BMP family ABC transporter substrate-binding protein [Aestuariivirga sp.]|uniref:BMP family ABC transporter substrate-binding protein n=1 Tax=Aestuariivirga sp. TaxID=2650926 RepID=UPI0039E567A1